MTQCIHTARQEQKYIGFLHSHSRISSELEVLFFWSNSPETHPSLGEGWEDKGEGGLPPKAQTRIHTRTRRHVHTHTCTHSQSHVQTRTHACTHAHTCTHIQIGALSLTHAGARTHKGTNTHAHTLHTHTHTHTNKCTRTHMQTPSLLYAYTQRSCAHVCACALAHSRTHT